MRGYSIIMAFVWQMLNAPDIAITSRGCLGIIRSDDYSNMQVGGDRNEV